MSERRFFFPALGSLVLLSPTRSSLYCSRPGLSSSAVAVAVAVAFRLFPRPILRPRDVSSSAPLRGVVALVTARARTASLSLVASRNKPVSHRHLLPSDRVSEGLPAWMLGRFEPYPPCSEYLVTDGGVWPRGGTAREGIASKYDWYRRMDPLGEGAWAHGGRSSSDLLDNPAETGPSSPSLFVDLMHASALLSSTDGFEGTRVCQRAVRSLILSVVREDQANLRAMLPRRRSPLARGSTSGEPRENTPSGSDASERLRRGGARLGCRPLLAAPLRSFGRYALVGWIQVLLSSDVSPQGGVWVRGRSRPRAQAFSEAPCPGQACRPSRARAEPRLSTRRWEGNLPPRGCTLDLFHRSICFVYFVVIHMDRTVNRPRGWARRRPRRSHSTPVRRLRSWRDPSSSRGAPPFPPLRRRLFPRRYPDRLPPG